MTVELDDASTLLTVIGFHRVVESSVPDKGPMSVNYFGDVVKLVNTDVCKTSTAPVRARPSPPSFAGVGYRPPTLTGRLEPRHLLPHSTMDSASAKTIPILVTGGVRAE